MKKTLMLFIALAMPIFIMAQEKTKQQEVGIAFNDLDNFGLTYKTGTEKSMWRFNALALTGNNNNSYNKVDSMDYISGSFGFNIKVGREYRKKIAENLEMRFGADLSFGYTHSKSEYNDKSIDDDDRLTERTTYSPGINLVFGINYVFKSNLILGAELLPYFTYNTGVLKEKNSYYTDGNIEESDFSEFRYGLSNTSLLLTLAYRF